MTDTQLGLQFYTLAQASAALGPGAVCEDTLRKEVKEGRLIAKRIGRCLRVTDVELRRWALDESTQSDSEGP